MAIANTLPEAEVLSIKDLITPAPSSITSRILAKTQGGNVTLFAFDTGQGLSEHTAPFDALVMVLDGQLKLTIGGREMTAGAGSVVRMPANVPHALDAVEPARMLLTMLREPKTS